MAGEIPDFGTRLVERIRAHLRSIGKDRLSAINAETLKVLANESFSAFLGVNRVVDTQTNEESDMAITGYTKLFSTILGSSIWHEPKEHKILWITMLALADKNGLVNASLPGLASFAGLTIQETQAGLNSFLAPDQFSRTKTDEGRRIREVEGGWLLVNHAKYRDMLNKEERREYLRIKKQESRKRLVGQRMSTLSAHTDSDTDTNTDREAKASLAAKPRARNELMDTLAEIAGIPEAEIAGNASALAKELKSIKAKTPDVTPDELRRRATNYHALFPELTFSVHALAKWWSQCNEARAPQKPTSAEANDRLNAF